jgi:hypothetical protein
VEPELRYSAATSIVVFFWPSSSIINHCYGTVLSTCILLPYLILGNEAEYKTIKARSQRYGRGNL